MQDICLRLPKPFVSGDPCLDTIFVSFTDAGGNTIGAELALDAAEELLDLLAAHLDI